MSVNQKHPITKDKKKKKLQNCIKKKDALEKKCIGHPVLGVTWHI